MANWIIYSQYHRLLRLGCVKMQNVLVAIRKETAYSNILIDLSQSQRTSVTTVINMYRCALLWAIQTKAGRNMTRQGVALRPLKNTRSVPPPPPPPGFEKYSIYKHLICLHNFTYFILLSSSVDNVLTYGKINLWGFSHANSYISPNPSYWLRNRTTQNS